MHKKNRIGIDITGADLGSKLVLNASLEFAKNNLDYQIILLGDKASFSDKFQLTSNIEKIITKNLIKQGEIPLEFRKKPDNPITKGIELLKNNEIDLFISPGNSGTLIANAFLKIEKINNNIIPGFMAFFPNFDDPLKEILFLDAGANLNIAANKLVEYAKYATIFSQQYYGINDPKVGLLNNGIEPEKGTKVLIEANQALSSEKSINFIGNVEASKIANPKVDILITEGWTGNIALKSMEGSLKFLANEIKQTISQTSIFTKIGGLLIRNSIKDISKKLDHRNAGGALIAGLTKPIIKAHGSSDLVSFKAIFKQAKRILEQNILENIKRELG